MNAHDFTVESLFVALMNGLPFAVAVAIAAWILVRFIPQISAAARHRIWWAALVAGLSAPLVFAPFDTTDDVPAAPIAAAVPGPRAAVAVVPESTGAAAVPLPHAPAEASVELVDSEFVSVIAVIWLAIVFVQLVRITRSFFHLRSLKAAARNASLQEQARFDHWRIACQIRRNVRLLVSDRVASPLAAGFVHPAVILPESLSGQLSDGDLDHVLLHELAHIARHDDWTNLATRVAAAFFALHPIARWILRQIDRDREIACDDWVVGATGQPKPYARSLARLFELCATRRRQLLATGMADRASQLRSRIEILVKPARIKRRFPKLRLAFTVVIVAAILIAAATTPPWIALADPPKAAPAQAAQRGSLLGALVAAGYGDLTVDEIIDLKNNGVDSVYIMELKESGWGQLTPRQMVQLRAHGVNPSYLGKLREAGFAGISADDVITLKNHNVTAEQLASIKALDVGPFTVRQIVDLHNHGVRTPLLRALKEAGFAKVDPREIIEAHNNGLRAEHFREAKSYGPSLTLKQIIKLKSAGVI